MASKQNTFYSYIAIQTAFLLFSLASNYQVYYITPSTQHPCARPPCHTLSHLADNITFHDSNMTLFFEPGNHTLDSRLQFSNIKILKLSSTLTTSSNIICTGLDVGLELFNINYVELSQLDFIGCVGNKIDSIGYFLMRTIRFQNQQGRRSVMNITKSTADAIHCHFISSNESQGPKTNITIPMGGAIFVRQSSVNFTNSIFRSYNAKMGGAIYGELVSNITITDTVFINNIANEDGGSIAAIHSTLSLQNCTFKNNIAIRGGAIFAERSSTVKVSKSGFIKCTGAKHAGAVYTYQSLLLIEGCEFIHNSAAYGGAVDAHYNKVSIVDSNFTFNMATYQGGALYVLYVDSMTLERCSFNTNIVISSTGAGSDARIYKVTLRISKIQFLSQENTTYNRETNISTCPQNKRSNKISGIALVIGYSKVHIDNTISSGRCMSWYAYNCTLRFTGTVIFTSINSTNSTMPGTLSTILSRVTINGNLTLLYNSAFNGGAIHAAESKFDIHGNLRIEMNKAMDSGGGIYLYRSELKCRETSNITIINNAATRNGGGVNAISSSIFVIHMRKTLAARSQLHFVANNASKGGGLYLEANAKLYVIKIGSTKEIKPSKSVVFERNSAMYGGAIFVADKMSAGVCQSSHITIDSDITECFLQVLSFLLVEKVPSPDHLISLRFTNNSATSGDHGHAIFGGLLDRCTLRPFSEVYHYNGNRTIYITEVSNLKANSQLISSEAVRICLCREQTPNCDYQPPKIRAKKGKEFSLSLVAVDQVNHTVGHTRIHSSLQESQLDIGQHSQKTMKGCTLLHFSISSPSNITYDTLTLYPEGPCGNAKQSQLRLDITFEECNCPVGFQQDPDHSICKCICDSRLKVHEVDCNLTTESIVKKSNFWIQYIHSSGKDGFVIHSPCPIGYCLNSDVEIKFNSSNTFNDEQCVNRSGILCGSCLPSHSLSIDSTHCMKCSDAWQGQMVGITLTTIFGGIALVAVIMVLDLTVATGTINGIIFYANVMNSGFIELAAPKFVISWLNLEFGFDVCFINGLDIYWKTWLQLLFPAYIFLLVALIVVISRQSLKFSHLIGKRNPVATLTTLILLSYTKFLRTTIIALSFTTLGYPNGTSKTVWLPDANIEYLQGKHIALFIAANLILLVGVAYTLLLFSWQWLLRNQNMWIFKWVRYQKLQNFLEPYHAPYTYQHRYWTGLLLVVRIALYLTSAINVSGDTDVTLYSITILTSALLFLKSAYNRGIYRNTLPNIIETICFVNIILCCTTNLYFRNSKLKVFAYISGTITTTMLLFIIIYHIFINFGIWKKVRSVTTTQITLTSISHYNSSIGPNTPKYTTSVIDGPPGFGEGNSDLGKPLLKSNSESNN